MEKIRINKYFSEMGILSRRAADEKIAAGAITVNGVTANVGMRVDGTEDIRLDGLAVTQQKPAKKVFAFYKPVGVVTTTKSFAGEENVLAYVPEGVGKVYPIGRLDKDSCGLLLLTNDGDLTKKITDASGHHEKEYEVIVDREMSDKFLPRMAKGLYIDELKRTTAACKTVRLSDKQFRITLTQGLNRQIRRMCEVLGYRVVSLKRIRECNILLGDMKPGEIREITGQELSDLRKAAGQSKKEKPTGRK